MNTFPEGFRLKPFLLSVEKQYIETALVSAKHCHAAAAKILGVNRTTLIQKMKRLGLPLKVKT